jgi:hypothetical protein
LPGRALTLGTGEFNCRGEVGEGLRDRGELLLLVVRAAAAGEHEGAPAVELGAVVAGGGVVWVVGDDVCFMAG